jgi:hypothetical protein
MFDLTDFKMAMYFFNQRIKSHIDYVTDIIYSYTPIGSLIKDQGYTVVESPNKYYYLSYEELWEL